MRGEAAGRALLVVGVACFRLALAQDLYSLIPKATDFYSTVGPKHFGPSQLRFSMTVPFLPHIVYVWNDEFATGFDL